VKKFILLFSTLFVLPYLAKSQLYINEILASNTTGIKDATTKREDWFEIYNASNASVNIANYYLSDDAATPTKFQVPSGYAETIIPAKGYLIIWASSTPTRGPLHTSFSLSKGGEYVGIYYSTSTPGSTNAGGVVQLTQLAAPTFSHNAGFQTAAFSLGITHEEPDVSIWYTLDGSDPVNNATVNNWQYKNRYNEAGTTEQANVVLGVNAGLTTAQYQSTLFVNPISIINRTTEANKVSMKTSSASFSPNYLPSYNVYKGTTIRVKVFKEGFAPSETVTRTFFVNPSGPKYTVPVIAVTSNERSFFDYTTGMYTAGITFDQIRVAHPTGAADICTGGNFKEDGELWERQGNVEFFENSNVLNQAIAFRIHGGCSRSLPEKTLRLYSGTEFNFPVFPEAPTRYPKRLLLRNSGNDNVSTMFRDSYYQKLFSNLTFDTQLSRPSIVFLNSEYWGIHNITDRYDRFYVNRKYGVDPDEVDLINMENTEVEEGDIVKFNELKTFVESTDPAKALSITANYNTLTTMIDIVNFTDYMIAEIFAGNRDWPHKNMRLWRAKVPDTDPDAAYGHDGRWRWMLYDTDLALAMEFPVATNFLPRAMGQIANEAGTIAIMFNKLLANTEYKKYFLTRSADLLNTTLNPVRTKQMLADIKAIYQPLMSDHIDRWKSPATLSIWSDNVTAVDNFMDQRPGTYRDNVRTTLGSTLLNTVLTLNVSSAAGGYVTINSIDILPTTDGVAASPYPWTGTYFQNVATKLVAVPKSGQRFVKWEDGNGNTFTTAELNITVSSATASYKAFFEASALPVVLKTFTAKKADRKVEVVWETTSEKDNDYFVVERASDALQWSGIATVKGSPSSSGSLLHYKVTDDQPFPLINYYRLKQVDLDQTTTYSRMVSVNMGNFAIQKLWPNPVSDYLNVNLDQPVPDAEFAITDLLGRAVLKFQKSSDANSSKIDIRDLKNGLYILTITSKEGFNYSGKFVKQ
jgi:hypothetical protein